MLYSALINGLIIAGFTGLGSVVAFAGFKLPRWGLDSSMSFAAGVMLVACFTSLIIPGFERGFYFDVGLGIAVGVMVMVLMDLVIPHEHLTTGYEGPEYVRRKLRKAILLALAVAIHNVPEGLAVGVSTIYSERLGFATALAIGLQDIPEGVAVALPLAILWSRLKGFTTGVLSRLVETVMALIGALVFTVAGGLLGLGMGFSAGAMIYIVVEEILPEVLRESSTYRKISAAASS
jgi:ZIP family zinc transporter